MKLRSSFTALVVIAFALAGWGQQSGSASGTLTVNGKVVKLNHAYAQVSKNKDRKSVV